MSRKGNCWDNAVAESFFSSLKKERIKKHIYRTRALALTDVADYIEPFYNRTRRHSHPGGVGPEQFEAESTKPWELQGKPSSQFRRAPMRATLRPLFLSIVVLVVIGLPSARAAGGKSTPAPGKDPIALALSAAPPSVRTGAAVVTMDDQGRMTELRRGDTGWTCMPTDPGTPVSYPVCVDPNGLAWFEAVMTGHEPDPGKVGYSYMLQGGTTWSNLDPMAMALPKGEKDWVDLPPHIMILSAKLAKESGFPSGEAHPNTHKPFVMYGGTPYAIIIIPVK